MDYQEYIKLVQRFYSVRAQFFDRDKALTWQKGNPFRQRVLSELLKVCIASRAKRGIDIGIGTGRISIPLLCRTDIVIYGIDISEEMLHIAKQKAIAAGVANRLVLVVGDGNYLSLKAGSMDIAICNWAFHYFNPDVLLPELSRILCNHGTAVIADVSVHEKDYVDFMNIIERFVGPHAGQFYKPSEISKLLQRYFAVVRQVSIPFTRLFGELFDYKALLWEGASPDNFLRALKTAPNDVRDLYDISRSSMTRYFTITTAVKLKDTVERYVISTSAHQQTIRLPVWDARAL